jgi:hypothetical protein
VNRQSLPAALGSAETRISLASGYETAESLAALAIARNASTPPIAAEAITATPTLNAAASTSLTKPRLASRARNGELSTGPGTPGNSPGNPKAATSKVAPIRPGA